MSTRIRSGLLTALTASLVMAPIVVIPTQAADSIVTIDSVQYYVDSTTVDMFSTSTAGIYERFGNTGKDLISISADKKSATIRQNKCVTKDPLVELVSLNLTLDYARTEVIKHPVGGKVKVQAPFTTNSLNGEAPLFPGNPNYTFNVMTDTGLPGSWPLVGTRTTANPLFTHETDSVGDLQRFQMSFYCNSKQSGSWTVFQPVVKQYSPVVTPTIATPSAGVLNLATGDQVIFDVSFSIPVTGVDTSDFNVVGTGSIESVAATDATGKNWRVTLSNLNGGEDEQAVSITVNAGIIDVNRKPTLAAASNSVSYVSKLDLAAIPSGATWVINRDSSLSFDLPNGASDVAVEQQAQPRSLSQNSSAIAAAPLLNVTLDSGRATLSGRVPTVGENPVTMIFTGEDGSTHRRTIMIDGADPQLADSQALNVVRGQSTPSVLDFSHAFDTFEVVYPDGTVAAPSADATASTLSFDLTAHSAISAGKVLFFDEDGYLGFAPFTVNAKEPEAEKPVDSGNNPIDTPDPGNPAGTGDQTGGDQSGGNNDDSTPGTSIPGGSIHDSSGISTPSAPSDKDSTVSSEGNALAATGLSSLNSAGILVALLFLFVGIVLVSRRHRI